MDECCQIALEAKYEAWLAANFAKPAASMTRFIHGALNEHAPMITNAASKSRVLIHVADTKSHNFGNQIDVTCLSGHLGHLIILTSPFLFFLWRLQVIAAGLVTEFTLLDTGANRWRFRAPTDSDIAQFKLAKDMYFASDSVEPVSNKGFEELLDAFESAPAEARAMLLTVSTLSQIFVVMHEVSHVLPLPDETAAMKLRLAEDTRVSKGRSKRWEKEINTDIRGATFLLISFLEKITQEHPDKSIGEVKLIGVPLVFAAVSTALSALCVVERQTIGDAPKPHVDQQFASHPPALLRYKMFRDWADRFAACSGIATEAAWAVNTLIERLCALLQIAYDERYPRDMKGKP